MATLSGTTPAATYERLLQVPNLDSTLRPIENGAGVSTPVEISTSGFNINGTFYIGGISVDATAAQLNMLHRTYPIGIPEPARAMIANIHGGINMSGGGVSGAVMYDMSTSYRNRDQATSTMHFSVSSGHYQSVLLVGSPTFTFYPTPSGRAYEMNLIIQQDSVGNRTVTWPGSVRWTKGSVPSLSTSGGAIDIFKFVTWDGGNIWYGFAEGLDLR